MSKTSFFEPIILKNAKTLFFQHYCYQKAKTLLSFCLFEDNMLKKKDFVVKAASFVEVKIKCS